MRRTVVLLATMALTLLVASGVALAVTRIGTDGPDTLMGTKGSDQLLGKGGSDRINGRGGNDVISGGPGNDEFSGPRPDGILAGGRGADVISGGPGGDLLMAAGLMTLEELGSKLAKLDETRRIATAELATLDAREQRAKELEADRDILLDSYAKMVPEALEGLSGEERSRVYEMLQLEVRPDPEEYEISGVLCSIGPTGRCRSCFTKDSSSAPLTRKPCGPGMISNSSIR